MLINPIYITIFTNLTTHQAAARLFYLKYNGLIVIQINKLSNQKNIGLNYFGSMLDKKIDEIEPRFQFRQYGPTRKRLKAGLYDK